ncbi:MAG: alkaline phosphatase family protein [Bacteroidota bacterium]
MKPIYISLFLISISALASWSCQAVKAQKANEAPFKYVVVIGVDGMSPNGIKNADTPHLDALIEAGAFSERARAVLPTSSSPNWASMIMGAGPEQHGITSNAWEKDRHQLAPVTQGKSALFPTIFSLVKTQMPQGSTAAIYDWKGFGRLFEKDMVDYDQHGEDEYETTKLATLHLKSARPTFTFIHLDHVDHAGHAHQHGSPEYYASVEVADSLIGEIIAATKEAAMYDDMLLILTADHGGKGYGHGGESLAEIEIPFLLVGAKIKTQHTIQQAVYTYDNAATAAYALGLDMPQAWIGRPVMDAFVDYELAERDQINSILPTALIVPTDDAIERKDGVYSAKEIEVKCIFFVPDAELRYTTDGSEPGPDSPLYQAPFTLNKTTTVKARAFKAAYADGPIASQTFEIQ